jgi:hypothetical protein
MSLRGVIDITQWIVLATGPLGLFVLVKDGNPMLFVTSLAVGSLSIILQIIADYLDGKTID